MIKIELCDGREYDITSVVVRGRTNDGYDAYCVDTSGEEHHDFLLKETPVPLIDLMFAALNFETMCGKTKYIKFELSKDV